MASISLKNISKFYKKNHALNNISLEIQDGEFIVFVGPSGCGKSTLLRSIAGLEEIDSGSILLDGIDITKKHPSERDVAMVFQSYALFPHMNVAQNIEFGLRINKVEKKIRREKVQKIASILQLDNLLDRKPSQLSGGQRQRVAIGRSIIKKPKVFLFDEPLSNLDAKLRVQMRVELENLHKTLKTTMIYVTHDQIEAMTMADRIVVLNGGIIEQFGTPVDLYQKPKTKFVAGFIGSPGMNFLKIKLDNSERGFTKLVGDDFKINFKKKLDINPKNDYELGVRPEDFQLVKLSSHISGKIFLLENLGSEFYVYIQLAQEKIIFKAGPKFNLKVGDKINLNLDLSKIHIFDNSLKNILV